MRLQRESDVVCQRHQVQVTTLTPVVSSTCCRCLPSFDHTDYSFTLPSLAILFFVQSDLHATPIFARGLFSRGTAEVGRDGGLYFEFVPRECMIRFTVVPRVCHDVADSYLPRCAFQRRFEISNIRAGTTRRLRLENQMIADIAHNSNFGKPRLGRCLPEILLT